MTTLKEHQNKLDDIIERGGTHQYAVTERLELIAEILISILNWVRTS